MVIFYSYVRLPEGNTSWYLDIYLDYDHWNYYKVIIVMTISTFMTMLSILLCITFITIKTKCDSYSYCNYCPKTISTYYHSCYPWMITIVPNVITRTTTITKLLSTLTCCIMLLLCNHKYNPSVSTLRYILYSIITYLLLKTIIHL